MLIETADDVGAVPHRIWLRRALLATLGVALAIALLATLVISVRARLAAEALPSPIDVGFAQAMSQHHSQAIVLAQALLEDPSSGLQPLARQIAYSQMVEFGEMQGWLKLWQQPVMPLKPSMDFLLLGRKAPDAALKQYLLDCQRSPSGMVGLASSTEVAALTRLRGRQKDARFVALMRAHHEGGLPMARFAAAEAREPAVRRLASNVLREQMQELHHLQRVAAAIAAHADSAAP